MYLKGDTMTDATQAPEQQTPNNDLTVNDLNAMKVIIDIASSRGAFKPNEMVAVGQTYAKLTAFLDAVAAQSQAAQSQQPAAPSAANNAAAAAITGA
jgi:hypothetical protein